VGKRLVTACGEDGGKCRAQGRQGRQASLQRCECAPPDTRTMSPRPASSHWWANKVEWGIQCKPHICEAGRDCCSASQSVSDAFGRCGKPRYNCRRDCSPSQEVARTQRARASISIKAAASTFLHHQLHSPIVPIYTSCDSLVFLSEGKEC